MKIYKVVIFKNKYMKKDEIEKMNYTDFIAFIQETNRCPGGKDTIRKIKNILNIDQEFTILDIGSNTGFNSLELAHITKSKIFGIDVSEKCVMESNRKLSEDILDVKNRVSFQIGSAYNIPFSENSFDLIIAGGATAFMTDKGKAINEYERVVKPWRYVCITPLFYNSMPPKELIHKINNLIGNEIKVMNLQDWINIFLTTNLNLELYYVEENKIKNRSENDIDKYVDYFLNKPHIKDLEDSVRVVIRDKWKNYIEVFNENHEYLSYAIVLFRKVYYQEEPEFFKVN